VITTLYGYKIPESNEKGAVVFPAMEDNIQRMNDHDHLGVNSKPLTPAAFPATVQVLLAGSWSLVADGIYKQTATVPAGLDYDLTSKEFRLSDGDLFYPTVNRLSNLQFEVFINDPTQAVTVAYK
jgi:hypothetical protein